MALRLDQANALEEAELHWRDGAQSVLLVQPTGTGKSHTAAELMLAQKHLRWAYVVHRDVLAVQTYERLNSFGLEAGICTGKMKRGMDKRVCVYTVQSLIRRVADIASRDRIIVDEAHRGEHNKLMERVRDYTGVRVLGTTATPVQGAGGLGAYYQRMVVGLTYPAAADAGLILRPKILAPFRPRLSQVVMSGGDYAESSLTPLMHRLMKDSVGAFERHCAGRRTIAFCVDRTHAKAFHEEITQRGHSAAYVDGETPAGERAEILARWKHERSTLVNIGVFAEGYDEPGIECVLNLAPTKSLARFMQLCGRGCRTAPGKSGYLLVDCAGSVFEHGSPAAHREWSLESGVIKPRSAVVFHCCKKCFAVYEGPRCDLCGAEPAPRNQAPKSESGDLEEIPATFSPVSDLGPAPKDVELEMTDTTRLRRRLYGQLQSRFREPFLTSRVSEAMKERVQVTWRGRPLVLPKHNALLW